jgi:hypothetical protein
LSQESGNAGDENAEISKSFSLTAPARLNRPLFPIRLAPKHWAICRKVCAISSALGACPYDG